MDEIDQLVSESSTITVQTTDRSKPVHAPNTALLCNLEGTDSNRGVASALSKFKDLRKRFLNQPSLGHFPRCHMGSWSPPVPSITCPKQPFITDFSPNLEIPSHFIHWHSKGEGLWGILATYQNCAFGGAFGKGEILSHINLP